MKSWKPEGRIFRPAAALGKIAVPILEFAVPEHHEGARVLDAALEGAKVRFRPILMTSLARIAPLVSPQRARGPGAIGACIIGAAALGGSLFATICGVIIVPGLSYTSANIAEGKSIINDEEDRSVTEASARHSVEEVAHHA